MRRGVAGGSAVRSRLAALVGLALGAIACSAASGPADGSTRDASADAARANDASSSVDCSTIGCAAPPVCSQGCTAVCGCCPCGDGQLTSIGGVAYVCTGGCYAPRGDGG